MAECSVYIASASVAPNPVHTGQQIVISCTISDVTFALAADPDGGVLVDADGSALSVK